MTAAQPRPRVVSAGFWCWAAASVLLVAFGLLLAFSPDSLPTLFRGMGVLFAVSGLGLGFLAGRARIGDARFRRAAIALALAIVIVLALFALYSRGPIWLVMMILTMVGAVLMMRPPAQEWFDQSEAQEESQ
jgi:peptidoglycan/LPS O-acetylase OafA/YrhL